MSESDTCEKVSLASLYSHSRCGGPGFRSVWYVHSIVEVSYVWSFSESSYDFFGKRGHCCSWL
uniref:Uncharacterized protein n=1 Tax=Hyaloperonospora arabidopsidis (strain Emoy2) TaxID=559515 RepID=M4B1Y5_HYAAE